MKNLASTSCRTRRPATLSWGLLTLILLVLLVLGALCSPAPAPAQAAGLGTGRWQPLPAPQRQQLGFAARPAALERAGAAPALAQAAR